MSTHDATSPAPIAVIAHAHPSISKGGAEIAAASLFAGLRELGIPAVFIAAVPYDQQGRFDPGPDEYPVFYDETQYDHFYQLSAPEVSRQLCAVICQTGAHLLIFHHFLHFGLNGLRDATMLAGRHAVLVLHEFISICHNHGQMITEAGHTLCNAATPLDCAACFPAIGERRFALRRGLFDRSYQLMTGFISPSRFLADRFCAWGLPRDRLHVIENGLRQDTTRHRRAKPPAGREFIFGYFGQVNPYKGADVLLRAARLLAAQSKRPSNIRIRIHGNIIGLDAAFSADLRQLCDTLPFLEYAGPYDNRQVLELMSQCDYIVVPSIWWENSPVVIQEAYTAGCPVICTGIGGMAEKVIDGVSGLHFRRGDAADLLTVMQKAAHAATFGHLQAGLPRSPGAVEMARRYVQTAITLLADEPGTDGAPQANRIIDPINGGAPKPIARRHAASPKRKGQSAGKSHLRMQ